MKWGFAITLTGLSLFRSSLGAHWSSDSKMRIYNQLMSTWSGDLQLHWLDQAYLEAPWKPTDHLTSWWECTINWCRHEVGTCNYTDWIKNIVASAHTYCSTSCRDICSVVAAWNTFTFFTILNFTSSMRCCEVREMEAECIMEDFNSSGELTGGRCFSNDIPFLLGCRTRWILVGWDVDDFAVLFLRSGTVLILPWRRRTPIGTTAFKVAFIRRPYGMMWSGWEIAWFVRRKSLSCKNCINKL